MDLREAERVDEKGPALTFKEFLKIKALRFLHLRDKSIRHDYEKWLRMYSWGPSQEDLKAYVSHLQKKHGPVKYVSTFQPRWKFHRLNFSPIHAHYTYIHALFFQDGKKQCLFQKFNFRHSPVSYMVAAWWSHLPYFSFEFGKRHKKYVAAEDFHWGAIHPDPKHLWRNHKIFLRVMGKHWLEREKPILGPICVLVNDTMTVTEAILGRRGGLAESAKNRVLEALHNKIPPIASGGTLNQIGWELGRVIRNCYDRKIALIDVNLGNFLFDEKSHVRVVDGETMQFFNKEVPPHYKASELILFLEHLVAETATDYLHTIGSSNAEDLEKYQHRVVDLFQAMVGEIKPSKEDAAIALAIMKGAAAWLVNLFFKYISTLKADPKLARTYHDTLSNKLKEVILQYSR